MSSIFLSNRSTWRTKLNAYLMCDFQMYSTQAPVYWINSLSSQYGARQFFITFSNQRAPTGSIVARFVRCIPGTRAKTSDDAADDVDACSCHKNASISCWGCNCHQFPPLSSTIYLKKYYSWLCRHYGVDFVVFSFRIQKDGAFLTLRTPAHGGLWNLAYPRCGHVRFI